LSKKRLICRAQIKKEINKYQPQQSHWPLNKGYRLIGTKQNMNNNDDSFTFFQKNKNTRTLDIYSKKKKYLRAMKIIFYFQHRTSINSIC
jgi:hypothetical protein